MKSKIQEMREISQQAIDLINTKIVEALQKIKGGKCEISSYVPGWGNLYDPTNGNRQIGRMYQSAEITFKVEAPSSYPSLKNPFCRNIISWNFISGTKNLQLIVKDKTDSVDVHFIECPKESKKNLTIGRRLKFNTDPKVRKIVAELNTSLQNDITLKYLFGALEYINLYDSEKVAFRSRVCGIAQMLSPTNTFTGLHLRKRTYYYNNTNLGTSPRDVADYFFNNRSLSTIYNPTSFPILHEN